MDNRPVRVCSYAVLTEGVPFHFERDGKHYILVKTPAGVFALDGVCTHEYAELWNGFITDDVITCPLHLSQFDIKTGEVISPPAEQPLRSYRTEMKDGDIWVYL
jgi:3-phenylpropionate/trans-cinnamate dioxygenase ferredoxin subunit